MRAKLMKVDRHPWSRWLCLPFASIFFGWPPKWTWINKETRRKVKDLSENRSTS